MFSASLWRCAALGAAVSLLVATGQSARSAPSVGKTPIVSTSRDALPAPTAIERKIEETLAKPTQMEFVDTPLQDVIDYVKDYHGIEIQLDKKALEEANVGTDTPISKHLKGIRLASALNLLLGEFDLAWTIRDDVLLITTQENASALMITKLYPVGDLVVCRNRHGELQDDYDTLSDMITSTVEPTIWDAVGGPCSIAGATLGNAKILVVSASYPAHRQIAEFLGNIRTIARESPKTEPPRRNRS